MKNEMEGNPNRIGTPHAIPHTRTLACHAPPPCHRTLRQKIDTNLTPAPTAEEQFKGRYEVKDCGHTTPCWIWTGSITTQGYGRFTRKGKELSVHRLAYELKFGPIPIGMHIDHLCRNRACCNAEHLEPVAQLENVFRGKSGVCSLYCLRGHRKTSSNIDPGHGCMPCKNLMTRELRRQKREARRG